MWVLTSKKHLQYKPITQFNPMKKFFKIILAVLAVLLVIGLFSGPSQADYDAVVAENEQLKAELLKYETTPDRLYKNVSMWVAEKNIDSLTVVCEDLNKYHPSSEECAKAQAALNKLIAEKEALAKAEKEKRMKAVNKLTSRYDDVSGTRWYYNPYFTHYNNTNRISLYIGKKEGGNPWMRLKMSYEGDNWIFFENAYISYDGQTFSVSFNEFTEKESDNGYGGRVWEWIDVLVTSEIHEFLKQMVEGKTLKMRLSGKYTETRILTNAEVNGLKDVLLAYDVLMNGE